MRKTKKLKKILITLIIILILGAGGFCAWFFLRPGRSESVKVYPFDLVGMTEFWGDTRESYGPVSTDRIQTVFLSDTQTVLNVPVKEGQEVKKGDLLMSFDTTLSQLELERKDLEIQKLALDLEEAEKELQRINWMQPMGTPPTEPETEPTLYPDFGRSIIGNFEAYRQAGHDGSTPDSAFVCWIWDGLVLTREFLQEGLGQLVDDSIEETAPTESTPDESTPTESAPTESTPAESTPAESTPTESTPTESTGGTAPTEAPAAPVSDQPTEAAAMKALLGNETLVLFSDLLSEDFETEIIPPSSSEATQPSETAAPTQPEATPPASSEPTTPSSEPAASSEPTNPSSESTDPSTEPAPSSEATDPSSESTDPSSEFTDPSSEPTASSSESTDPSSEPTDPSSEPTDPSSEPTDPSEESTDPSEESTEPTEEEPEDEDKMCYPYFVIFKVTRDNMLKGDVLVWQGVHVHPDGSISFFDASGIEDYSLPKEPEEETEPTVDYIGSGYTYSQIVKMRQEQEKKIADLKLQQRLAEADYRIMERELSDGNVYAELDGKVLSVLTEEDAKLNSQPLIKLSGGGGFYIEASVSELERGNISVGMEVTVNDWEGGGTYSGVITSIGDIPTSSGSYNGMDNPNASSYPFRVFVDEGADLRAGGYVSVEYSSSSSQNGIYLQNPFLRTAGGRSFVYVQGEDGLLEERTVTTGKSVWGSYTEIVEGLTADDMVAFPYGKNVRPGVPTDEGDLSDLYGY